MKLRLISLDYQVPQCDTRLKTFPAVIGRAAEAAIRLDDPSVADHHCRIVSTDDGLVVSDLGTVHGTAVNGCRITDSILRPGDELAVGLMKFLVQIDAEPEAAPKTSPRKAQRADCNKRSPVGAMA